MNLRIGKGGPIWKGQVRANERGHQGIRGTRLENRSKMLDCVVALDHNTERELSTLQGCGQIEIGSSNSV
ncbi:hypothetical protein SUGI_0276510 [Cryptomeria japonica]|nr:hypothetical protein SUGI_0276510 [Cryptomeria japonica]